MLGAIERDLTAGGADSGPGWRAAVARLRDSGPAAERQDGGARYGRLGLRRLESAAGTSRSSPARRPPAASSSCCPPSREGPDHDRRNRPHQRQPPSGSPRPRNGSKLPGLPARRPVTSAMPPRRRVTSTPSRLPSWRSSPPRRRSRWPSSFRAGSLARSRAAAGRVATHSLTPPRPCRHWSGSRPAPTRSVVRSWASS